MKYPLSSILQEERKDMTIRECYEKTGSDYESILKRFGSEAMIQRFALKFLKDGSFSDLKNALEAKDGERAFRAAHTLKGVCINLGFDRLYNVSAELTEKLRGIGKRYNKAAGRRRNAAFQESLYRCAAAGWRTSGADA